MYFSYVISSIVEENNTKSERAYFCFSSLVWLSYVRCFLLNICYQRNHSVSFMHVRYIQKPTKGLMLTKEVIYNFY